MLVGLLAHGERERGPVEHDTDLRSLGSKAGGGGRARELLPGELGSEGDLEGSAPLAVGVGGAVGVESGVVPTGTLLVHEQ